MKSQLFYFALCLLAFVDLTAQDESSSATSFTEYVNPFIGTGGHGHTFPGATLPFGMMQLSPDTRLTGWDGCGGYHYTDNVIYGFSHTHLSGTGVSDYGDILLKPCIGELFWENGYDQDNPLLNSYASQFSKEQEEASPGYYKVKLEEGIEVELSTSTRAGMHRYRFDSQEEAHVLLDLSHRDELLDANYTVVNDYLVTGFRRSKAWATDQHLYFALEFDQPITKTAMQKALILSTDKPVNAKAAFFFELDGAKEIKVRIGISAVDEAGALNNLRKEIPHWDFEKVRKEANSTWNDALKKIAIGDTERTEDKTVFYSALYHSMIAPNIYSDVDGRYRKVIPKKETKSARLGPIGKLEADENQYTVFSLWDTFRTTHPLFTIIEQDRTAEFIRTFLRQYQDGGQLPVWELASTYTGCMIGYHSVSVINDAHQKGIVDFDESLALEAMFQSAEKDELGLDDFRSQLCLSTSDEHESVSKTLEYAYDDWCIAEFAQRIKQPNKTSIYLQRAQAYKNLYSKETGFLQGRRNGGWYSPFLPEEVNFNYTEANGWQYSLFAPQDVNGLIDLMGGDEAFVDHLDKMFDSSSESSGRHQVDITGLIGQYAQGNEPSHHVAYLYAYAGEAWKTQDYTSAIMDSLYWNGPDGLSGNEDCGQMSSWYVMSALGFYPVCPGDGQYVFGTPKFADMEINLENGKQFQITADGLEQGPYIRSVLLNGVDYPHSFISHDDLMDGGSLHFVLGAKPNKSFGALRDNRPSRRIGDDLIAINPSIDAADRIFENALLVEMNSPQDGAQIYYSTDGTEPTKQSNVYSAPISLKETSTIKAIAIVGNKMSKVVSADFYKIDQARTINIRNAYASQYAAGGDKALIDLIKGSEEFTTGDWQGYREDLDIVVDLGEKTQINKLRLGTNQNIRSWIWFPSEVSFALSNKPDSKFKTVAVITNEYPDNEEGALIKHFEARVDEKARYVRVRAKQYGECPAWHSGAGGKTWIFVDELEIE